MIAILQAEKQTLRTQLLRGAAPDRVKPSLQTNLCSTPVPHKGIPGQGFPVLNLSFLI